VGGFTAFTWVLDHFLYIPVVGLIALMVAALDGIHVQLPSPLRSVGVGLVAMIMACMAWGSREYAKNYVNQSTLWTYTCEHNPEAWLAHANLGKALAQSGRLPEAIDHYQAALRINPLCVVAHSNLGAALFQVGRIPEAMEQLETALKIDPNYGQGHDNMGTALARLGRMAEAKEQFKIALQIHPNDIMAQKSVAWLEAHATTAP
jgi:tetratricopeptide (TPR) repeat protein